MFKPFQWIAVRRNREVDVSILESCPVCRSHATYHDMLLKNTWWRRLLRLVRHKPVRIECDDCGVMLDCSGLRKEYAFLLWNRRKEHPKSHAERLGLVITERDNLRSLVAQLTVQRDAALEDYNRIRGVQ